MLTSRRQSKPSWPLCDLGSRKTLYPKESRFGLASCQQVKLLKKTDSAYTHVVFPLLSFCFLPGQLPPSSFFSPTRMPDLVLRIENPRQAALEAKSVSPCGSYVRDLSFPCCHYGCQIWDWGLGLWKVWRAGQTDFFLSRPVKPT